MLFVGPQPPAEGGRILSTFLWLSSSSDLSIFTVPFKLLDTLRLSDSLKDTGQCGRTQA